MPTLFRKEYPRKSRATEFLFLILFIVLMIPIPGTIDHDIIRTYKMDIAVLEIALASLAAEPAGKLHEYKPVGYQRLVDELTMLVKQLTWQLRKAKPGCKLPDKVMDYLERSGLISVEDVLR